MRYLALTTASLAALLVATPAFATECDAGAAADDCDGDGVLDDVDLCPFDEDATNAANTSVFYAGTDVPLPTGAACTDAGAFVAADATIGFGVSLRAGARVMSRAYVGDFAEVGGGSSSDATVGVKAILVDAPSPFLSTKFVSGVVGRRSDVGSDPSGSPQPQREGDVRAGEDLTLGREAIIGFGARLGASVSLGYGAEIGPQAIIGDRVVVGNLSTIGWGAQVGSDFVLARNSHIGNFAVIGDSVTVGPEVNIGTYAQVGSEGGASVRIRKGVDIGKWTTIAADTAIGRGSTIGDYSYILEGIVLRADTIVEPGAIACDSDNLPDTGAGSEWEGFDFGTADCSSGGYYPRADVVTGLVDRVPKEPSGSFFSAAGGVVCANPGTNGCGRILDESTGRYCLDTNGDGACDAGTAGVPAYAIVITAPDTIGVSPYCYNDSEGVTHCETLQSPSESCGGEGEPPCYQLQAGPIYVLSPPDPQ